MRTPKTGERARGLSTPDTPLDSERRAFALWRIERNDTACYGYGGILCVAQNSADHAITMGATESDARDTYATYRDFIFIRRDELRRAAWTWAYGRTETCPPELTPEEFDSYVGELLRLVRAARRKPEPEADYVLA